jgi:hypothetical protein
VGKSKSRALAHHADASLPESQLPPGTPVLLNADGDARQIDADGRAVNHRRWSIIIRRPVNHRRGRIIPAAPAPAAMPIAVTVAAAMIIPAPFRTGRRERRPQHKKRREYQPCRKSWRQMTTRIDVADAGHNDLL